MYDQFNVLSNTGISLTLSNIYSGQIITLTKNIGMGTYSDSMGNIYTVDPVFGGTVTLHREF